MSKVINITELGKISSYYKRKKKKIVRRENIDLNTIDEVMRLIMERGIMR